MLETDRGHRDLDLDFIRGIAVSLIIILHSAALIRGIEDSPLINALLMRTSVGMQLFFVLSGYMIAQSWDKLKEVGMGRIEFYQKRAAKILPLYIIFLHLNIALYFFQRWQGYYSDFPNGITQDNLIVTNYFVHLVMAQGLVPAWQHSLLDGSWSIVAEVYFYALAPWILDRFLTHPAPVLRWLCFAVPAGIFFSFLARNQEGYWGYYGFPAQFPCFLLGILAQRARKSHPEVRLGAAAFPFIAFASLIAFGLFQGETFPVGLHIVYACLFSAILFVVASGDRQLSRLPGAAIVVEFGRMSYALFLAHLFLLKVAHPWIMAHFVRHEWPAALAANLFFSVVVNWIVCRFVFHPIDSAIVRLQNRKIRANHAIGKAAA